MPQPHDDTVLLVVLALKYSISTYLVHIDVFLSIDEELRRRRIKAAEAEEEAGVAEEEKEDMVIHMVIFVAVDGLECGLRE